MLVPAAVLVLMILGALAVDAALAFLGQRALTNAAAAAANDAAALAVSDAAFYTDARGPLVLDGARAEAAAADAVAHAGLRGVEVLDQRVAVRGAHVCVHLVGRVRFVFSPVVPGVPRTASVHGRAVATAAAGGAGTPVPTTDLDC